MRGIDLAGVRPAVANPYLEAARALDPLVEEHRWSEARMRQMPPVGALERRWEMASTWAWAIPNDAALAALAALGPIVEIGAGAGYWAGLLRAMGVDVVAYDITPGFSHWTNHEPYTEVLVGNWRAARQHPDRTLFLCWPVMSRLAHKALRAYRGSRLAYVGEPDGGCCADDRFFRLVEREWEQTGYVQIPTWWGLNDAMWLYRRREAI